MKVPVTAAAFGGPMKPARHIALMHLRHCTLVHQHETDNLIRKTMAPK